jgi:hypothetical protein
MYSYYQFRFNFYKIFAVCTKTLYLGLRRPGLASSRYRVNIRLTISGYPNIFRESLHLPRPFYHFPP